MFRLLPDGTCTQPKEYVRMNGTDLWRTAVFQIVCSMSGTALELLIDSRAGAIGTMACTLPCVTI